MGSDGASNKTVAVSVIIPVYNGSEWITRCLESLTEQSFQDYEAIIIDDGSTDDTFKLAEAYANRHNQRIRLYHQENAGQSAARNKALSMAIGEYIVFLDSDDYIDSDYLQTLYYKIHTERLDCVVCGYKMVDQQGKLISEVTPNPEDAYYRVRFLACCSKIYRREYLEKIGFRFSEGKLYEDTSVNWLVLYQSPGVEAIRYSGYYYVQRLGSSRHMVTSFEKIPCEADEAAIHQLMTAETVFEKDILAYSVLNYAAYMLFCVFHHAPIEVIKQYVSFSEKIVKLYIKAPFRTAIRGLNVTSLTLSQRIAVLVFVVSLKTRLTLPLSWCLTRL